MPDGAVTVDELAIRVAANATSAAASIDLLTASLQRLSTILGPTLTQLSTLGTRVGRVSAGAATAVGAATAASSAGAAAPAAGLAGVAAAGTGAVGAAAVATGTAATGAAAAATNAALTRTGGVVAAVKAKVSSLTQSLRDMGKSGSSAANNLGGSFIQLRSWVFFTLFGVGLLIGAFKKTVDAASQYIEKINLFNVAMGEYAKQANTYVDNITSKIGMDPLVFRDTLSTFNMMTRSLGMTAETAYTVSRGFTQLAYDYASLKDMDFETVAQKFRSAIAGQTRAIAALGLDVTKTNIQQEMMREGIKAQFNDLTKANKVILIYNLATRASGLAQQDLARTLASPANMMRILGDQFTIVGRTIGYLFIPMLQAALPWLIAFAQGLNYIAHSMLGSLGIKMPNWGDMMAGITRSATGADDLFEGLDKSAEAAKKLKDYTLGIDELNILAPPTDNSASGKQPDIKPLGLYDMLGGLDPLKAMLTPIRKMFDDAARALKPFIDAVKRVWEALKPFIRNVWTGFTDFFRTVLLPLATWTMNTVGVWVLDRMRDILDWFNAHPGAAKALGTAFAVFATLKGLDFAIGILSKLGGLLMGMFGFSNITGLIGGIAGAFLTLGDTIGAVWAAFAVGGAGEGFVALGTAIGPAGWIALGIAAVIAAFVLLVNNWDRVKDAVGKLWAAMSPLRDLFDKTTAAIQKNMGPAIAALMRWWDNLKGAVGSLQPVFDDLNNMFGGLNNSVGDVSKFVFAVLIGLITSFAMMLPGVVQAVSGASSIIVASFHAINDAAQGDFAGAKAALADAAQGFADVSAGAMNAGQQAAGGFVTGFTAANDAVNNLNGTNWDYIETTKNATGETTRYRNIMMLLNGTGQDTARTMEGLMVKADSFAAAQRRTTEADIANLRAKLDLKAAQKDYNTAVAQYGKNSDEAQNALLRVRDAELRAKDAGVDYINAVKAEKPMAELDKIRKKWDALIATMSTKVVLTLTGQSVYDKNVGYGGYATGGMPPRGSMFLAGESGPELTGSFNGNPNTVMPLENSGFVEAMYGAVFKAVVNGMSGLETGGNGDIYMDGKKVGAVLRDSERRNGIGGSLVKVVG
jgi:hypothetical protein